MSSPARILWQKTADESITAFASVRNSAATSDPSFGDWLNGEEQAARGVIHAADVVPAMIEVTRGSPNKYEVEKETGQMMLDRVLHSSIFYPGDYGYVPQTLCGDGDPLDILIVSPAESSSGHGLDPGCIANCRVIGLMDMEDEGGHDEKLIAVLANQRGTEGITRLEHVPSHMRREIQHFFENYKLLEMKKGKPKWAKVLGWMDREKALEVVAKSRQMYLDNLKSEGKPKLHPFVRVPKCPNMLHVKQELADSGPLFGGRVTCFVNVSKGSQHSYAYRQDTTHRHYKYTLDMPYPGDYGWICQTWQDTSSEAGGKPVEVLILSTFPLSPECLAEVRIVGAIERTRQPPQKDGGTLRSMTDLKVFAVLADDPRMEHVRTLSDVNPTTVGHFSHFVVHSAEAAGCQDCRILRQIEAEETVALVQAAYERYQAAFTDKVVHNAPNLWCLPWGSDATQGAAGERVYPAVVEASKHTSNKYSFDMEYGVLKCDGPLHTACFFPGNYGFLPQTVAEHGKPVGVIILSTRPLENKCVCQVRLVGAARCINEMGPEIQVIAVPKNEPRMKEWQKIADVPKHMLDEMVHFFNAYKDLEDEWKFCRFENWMDSDEVMAYLSAAHSRFFLFVLPMKRIEKRVLELEEENRRLRSRLAVDGKA